MRSPPKQIGKNYSNVIMVWSSPRERPKSRAMTKDPKQKSRVARDGKAGGMATALGNGNFPIDLNEVIGK